MKNLNLTTLTLLLLIQWATSEARILAERNGVVISADGATLKCDRIICPSQSFRCRVTRQLDPKNPLKLLRTNTCYNEEGDQLFETQKTTHLKEPWHKYLDLSADLDGVVILNEELKSGFHISTSNFANLRGKEPGYINRIANIIDDARVVMAGKMTTIWKTA